MTRCKKICRHDFTQSGEQIKEFFNKAEVKNSFNDIILIQFRKTPYRDTKQGIKYRYELFTVNNEYGYINSITYKIFCILYTADVKSVKWHTGIPCSIIGLDGTEDVITKVINDVYRQYNPYTTYKLKFVQVAI